MNKKHLIISLAALGVLAASVGGATSVYAAANKASGKMINNKSRPVLSETQTADMQAKRQAVEAALTAGDYKAWVVAEKNFNPNCPTLSKINEGNFSRYAEAWKLRSQADVIMKDLGVPNGEGIGQGKGKGLRGGRGGHFNGQGLGSAENVN